MKRSLIRTDEEREARNELVQYNREKRKQIKVLQDLGLVRRKYQAISV